MKLNLPMAPVLELLAQHPQARPIDQSSEPVVGVEAEVVVTLPTQVKQFASFP